jgi:hypothetical protein
MKRLSIFLLVASFLLSGAMTGFSQDIVSQGTGYFGKYKDGKSVSDLCLKSLPTKEDCKRVFIGTDADTYFLYAQELGKKMGGTSIDTSVYKAIRLESFTKQDIIQDKGNYAGGMKNIKDKLQDGVTFYEVNFLRNAGDEHGVAWKYWVNIDNRWVFFPKPWRAFKE